MESIGDGVANKKFIILAALPFLLVAAVFLASRAVDFEQVVFSPVERRVLHFSPDAIEVRVARGFREAGRKVVASSSSMAGFFRPGTDAVRAAGGGGAHGLPGLDPLAMKVSFIMRGAQGASHAIVNDELVVEGDIVGGMLVKRIEEDKVLLKGKESRWIYMEALR